MLLFNKLLAIPQFPIQKLGIFRKVEKTEELCGGVHLVRRTIKFRRLTKRLRKRAVFERKTYLLAYSTARVSLITVIRICPGNVSDSSIFLAISRLSKVDSSSEILSLSTMTLSSLPA